MKVTTSTLKKFHDKYKKGTQTDDCWVWQAATFGPGSSGRCLPYGAFNAPKEDGSKKLWLAHRFSYSIHKGDIPEGKIVMHSCDNPRCVNPDHLSAGTMKENMDDCIKKGRRASGDKSFAGKKIVCPHCSKVGGSLVMKRWHGDMCRNKK